eukprot:187804-Pelagomonas_calceolata.AAC.2
MYPLCRFCFKSRRTNPDVPMGRPQPQMYFGSELLCPGLCTLSGLEDWVTGCNVDILSADEHGVHKQDGDFPLAQPFLRQQLSVQALLDLLLAGEDQPQADQPNRMAEGLLINRNKANENIVQAFILARFALRLDWLGYMHLSASAKLPPQAGSVL